ncbi:MAG: anti-sigma factor [Thermoleophilia bacterium]|nr:anti-sigma factor [Thermoleophilia bacterium]
MTDRLHLSCTDVDDLAALYVLDALGTPEATEVASHLADHPDRHPAFREMAGVTPFLAESVPPLAPPPDLRGRVLGAIAATPQLPAAPVTPAVTPAPVTTRPVAPPPGPVATPMPPTASQPAPFSPPPVLPPPVSSESYQAVRDWTPAVTPGTPGTPVAAEVAGPVGVTPEPGAPVSLDAARARKARRTPMWGVLAAAAVLAIVVLGGWNVLLQQQRSAADGRLAVLAAAVAAAGQPGAAVAPMTGSDAAAGASGYAVFPAAGTGYIVLTGLPAAGSGQVWQAWTIAGDAPASAGLMDVGEDGIAVLDGIIGVPGTSVVALTVEPAGGSQQPTTTPAVVGPLDAPLATIEGRLALVR